MKTIKFYTMTAIITTVVSLSGTGDVAASGNTNGTIYDFPELGYAYSALEPWIDAQTMELHYTKHFRAYYDNFIKAATEAGLSGMPVKIILANVSKYPAAIRNNGGGYYNHALFWENMTGDKQEIPSELRTAIEKDFGSWDAFKTSFETAAKTQFGSGWAWLSLGSDGKLFVSSTPNQDNPLMDVAGKQGTPLLALDVWEHAYYLKYLNRRAEYVENFWNIVNWKTVLHRMKEAQK